MLAVGDETDHTVLYQFIRFQEYIIIVVIAILGKSCFNKEAPCNIGGKIMVYTGFILLEGEWNPEQSSRVVDSSKDKGISNKIAFLINTFMTVHLELSLTMPRDLNLYLSCFTTWLSST